MPLAEPSGRVPLIAGVSAAFVAAAFAYLHTVVLVGWPEVALDGSGTMLAYFATGLAFQFGIPVLCLTAFVFGRPTRRLWTARIGLMSAAAAMLGYALYVRSCIDMIR